jgi:hypothetical protein
MPVLKRTKGPNPYGTFIPTGEIVACGEMAKMSDAELREIMHQPHAKVVRVVFKPKKKEIKNRRTHGHFPSRPAR